MAKRTVGYFSQDQLEEFASRPNTSVYQPTHDIVFEPWKASRTAKVIQRILGFADKQAALADAECSEFAQTHPTIFDKLHDPAFVKEERNIKTLLKLVQLRYDVEQGRKTETDARSTAAAACLGEFSQHAGAGNKP